MLFLASNSHLSRDAIDHVAMASMNSQVWSRDGYVANCRFRHGWLIGLPLLHLIIKMERKSSIAKIAIFHEKKKS